MSTREIPAGAHSRPLAPLHRADTLAQFRTYSSASFDEASGLPLERTKFFQPLLDVLAIAVAVVFGLSAGLSIIVFFAMLFFMRF